MDRITKRRIITLLTDFGEEDGYVGAMKGVIKSIAPHVDLVDITHSISPHDIMKAAFALNSSYEYFPAGTIHLVVVDPGVGTERKGLAISCKKGRQSKGYFFVGPDNGVFSFVVDREKVAYVVELENNDYFLKNISNTFHGRDIFSPVAAYLALDVDIKNFGKKLEGDIVRLKFPEIKVNSKKIEGEIVEIDRFGNLITNIPSSLLNQVSKERFIIRIGSIEISVVCRSYGFGKIGEPMAISGSSGYLEIALNKESAQKKLGFRIGDKVNVFRRRVK